MRFQVGDFTTDQKGSTLKVQFLVEDTVGREDFVIPSLNDVPRGHLPAQALRSLFQGGDGIVVDINGKRYISVGERLVTVSLSILHAFAHKCRMALSAAHVPGAPCDEAVERAMSKVTPRSTFAVSLTPSNHYLYWAQQFSSWREKYAPEAPRDSIKALLNALANTTRRIEDLRNEFTKCKKLPTTSGAAAFRHDLFSEEPTATGSISPALSAALDALLSERQVDGQGGRGGFLIFASPDCQALLNQLKARRKREEVVVLQEYLRILLDATGAGEIVLFEEKQAAHGTRSTASGAPQVDPFQQFLIHGGSSPAVSKTFKKIVHKCMTAADAKRLVEAHAAKVSKDDPMAKEPPETIVRRAVEAIFRDFYDYQYFKVRMGAQERRILSDLEKIMYVKRMKELGKQISDCIEVFNNYFEHVPAGVRVAAGGKWTSVVKKNWLVPPLKEWKNGALPEEVFPANLLPKAVAHPLCNLLYCRDMVQRALEGVQRSHSAVLNVHSNLLFAGVAMRRMLLCVDSATFAPDMAGRREMEPSLHHIIPQTLRAAARGARPALILPSPPFQTWLRSHIYSLLRDSENLVSFAERAVAAANCWTNEGRVAGFLPCKHVLPKLRYAVNDMLRGLVPAERFKHWPRKCRCTEGEGEVEDYSETEEEGDSVVMCNTDSSEEEEEEEEEEE